MRNGISGRDITVAAGGIAIGMVTSRLLAPIIAMSAGPIQSGGDPFERLEEDHRSILKTVHEMEQAHDRGKVKRATLFLSLKRRLEKHAMAEEDVVYPLLTDEAHRRDAAKHLYDEHADMKILLFEIEMALMHGEPRSHAVSKLRQIIERHAREEENEQFPKLREVLQKQRLGQVVGRALHRSEVPGVLCC